MTRSLKLLIVGLLAVAAGVLVTLLASAYDRIGLAGSLAGIAFSVLMVCVIVFSAPFIVRLRRRSRIDHRARSTEPFEEAERRRLLVETSTDPVLVSQDNRIHQVNRAAVRILGAQNADQLLGRPTSEIFHPELDVAARERVKRLLEGRNIANVEARILRLDGAACEVELAACPFQDHHGTGVQILLRDATERRRLEKSARQERDLMQLTLTCVADAVLTTNAEGRITYLNPAGEQLTGWKKDHALGQPLHNVLRLTDATTGKSEHEIFERLLHERTAVSLPGPIALVTRDGREVRIEESAAPIEDKSGTLIGIAVVFRESAAQSPKDSSDRNAQPEDTLVARDLLQSLMHSTPDRIIAIDSDLSVIALNRLYEDDCRRLFGLDISRGSRITECPVLVPMEKDQAIGLWARALKGENFRTEHPSSNGGLHPSWYELHFFPIRNQEGKINGAAQILRDVTARGLMEDALKEANEILQRRLEEHQAALRRAKDQLHFEFGGLK